ncbi:MAG: DUF374 domain-containing protein [Vampirovibrionales bacterium]|nr:DUF374 domain-containing protein [Vampirovibrionales bacterium]
MAAQAKRAKLFGPLRRQLARNAIGFFGPLIIQSACATWRKHVSVHPETQALVAAGRPVLFVMWHGRMFSMLTLPVARKNLCVLISGSNDGKIITSVAHQLGFGAVASGSAHKGGAQAARTLLDKLGQGYSLVVTADGPRGPKYRVKPGVIKLAALANVPVVPVIASAAQPILQFPRAWDDFHAPNYFASIQVQIGAPCSPSEAAVRLEAQLIEGTRALDAQHPWCAARMPAPVAPKHLTAGTLKDRLAN